MILDRNLNGYSWPACSTLGNVASRCQSVSFIGTIIIAGVGLEIPPVRACHGDGGQKVHDRCLQGMGGKVGA